MIKRTVFVTLLVSAAMIITALSKPTLASTPPKPRVLAETVAYLQTSPTVIPATQDSGPLRPIVGHPVKADVSPALRDVQPVPPDGGQIVREIPMFSLPGGAKTPMAPAESDPVLQSQAGQPNMPSPLQSFEGVSNVNGVYPPDTQGDIGYDPATSKKYYVQWVNLSFAIWDVTTGTLGSEVRVYGPARQYLVVRLWRSVRVEQPR